MARHSVLSQTVANAKITTTKNEAQQSPEEVVHLLESVLKPHGWDRAIATRNTKGGYPDLMSAWDAVIHTARRFPHEGPLRVQRVQLGLSRRSWAILEDGGRYFVLADSWPKREPTVLRGKQVKELYREAQQLIKPIRDRLRRKKARNPRSQIDPMRVLYPDSMARLERAGLTQQLFVPWRMMPTLSEIAAELVHVEHPEAGSPSTIRRNANLRQLG